MPQAASSHRHFEIEGHPAWKSAFRSEARDIQLEEDLFAGQSVSGLLLGIVSVGLLLGIVAVLLAL